MYRFDEEKHIHSFDSQPLIGTTTLISGVMPPMLARWGAQTAVDYVKETGTKTVLEGIPIIAIEEPELDKAVNAWTKVRNKAATKGTDMHAELEKYVQNCIDNGGAPVKVETEHDAVKKFSVWAYDNVLQFVFCEKNTYSKRLWTGGIVDCLAKLKGGQLAVIDFKSGKDTYFSSVAQVAGYALQLEESGYGNADGTNWHLLTEPIAALIVVPFGAATFKPTRVDNVKGFKEVFEHLAAVYTYLQAFNKRDK